MYFWNIEKLSKELKVGLSEKEAFKYLFSTFIMFMFALLFTSENSFNEMILYAYTTVVYAIMLVYCFKINSKNYSERIISIGFVFSIREVVVFISFYLGYKVINSVLNVDLVEDEYMAYFIMCFVFSYYIIKTCFVFKKINVDILTCLKEGENVK